MKLTNVTIGTPPVAVDTDEGAEVFSDGKRLGRVSNLTLGADDVLRGDLLLDDKADLSKPLTVRLAPLAADVELSISIPEDARP